MRPAPPPDCRQRKRSAPTGSESAIPHSALGDTPVSGPPRAARRTSLWVLIAAACLVASTCLVPRPSVAEATSAPETSAPDDGMVVDPVGEAAASPAGAGRSSGATTSSERLEWPSLSMRALELSFARLSAPAFQGLQALGGALPRRARSYVHAFALFMCEPGGLHAAAVWLLFMGALWWLERRFGRPGELCVCLAYPSELRGSFSVRLHRRKPRADLSKRARPHHRKSSRVRTATRTEQHQVAREARFVGLAPREYWVELEGILEDPARGERLRRISEVARADVFADRTERIDFDFHPRGFPLEVQVSWDGQPVDQACIRAVGEARSSRYTRHGVARLELPEGTHRILIGCGDRVASHDIRLSEPRVTTLHVELAGSEALLFKGCPPAVGPYLEGDVERAAECLEREGQQRVAWLILADRDRSRGQLERAAEGYVRAGECMQAAQMYAERNELLAAARCAARSERSEDDEQAQSWLEQIPPESEGYDSARELLAELLLRQDDVSRALAILESLRDRGPSSSELEGRIEAVRKRVTPRAAHGPVPESLGAGSGSRYDILEQIGRGGMGVVFKARDRRLGRYVALKQLPENLRDHPTAIALFMREARAAAALNHPNIVTLYDVDEDAGKFFITMELLEGLPLNHVLRHEGQISAWRCCRLGMQIAAGLRYAHEKRIVHRDIKTANLFWTREKVLKITDFGLAKMLEEVRKSTTVVGGTPYYVAPEQSRGEDVDARADLYSVGVTLFELCTGSVPFREGDVLQHHRETPAPDARERNPVVPEAFSRILLQLMAKDPDARIQNAAELGTRLAACADELLTASESPA